MSLADDLLEQARALATLDPRRPRQVNLRRAISSAYYAVFHLLTTEASRLYVRDDSGLAGRLGRTFNHGEMQKVSREFANGQLPRTLKPPAGTHTITPDLVQVARSFTNLQQARHSADYDLNLTFSRDEAVAFVEEAESAFAAWERVKGTDDARLYLACFLLWDTWNKPPR